MSRLLPPPRAYFSALRSAQAQVAFGAEDIAIEIGDPLPPARSDVEIADRGLDMRRNAVPVKLRVEIGEIGRRRITKLPIHPDLFELEIQCIGLAQVMRIAELADEIGGAHQRALFV